MNRLIALSLLLTVFTFSHAQDCSNPMSQPNFQAGFNLIASQITNQKKLDRSLELVGKNCLMSSQVKNMAVLFSEDSYRFEFCRAAYLATFDRVNFFEVYDAFTSFSYAIRLYDFTRNPTQELRPIADKVSEQPITPIKPKFAEIVYPSPFKYLGKKGCDGPVVNETNFNTLALQVASQPTDESKHVAIETSLEEGCYSLAHVMKLTSLIASEKLRFRTLTQAFARAYDQDHYMSARALFTSVELQNQWVSSAQFALAPPETTPTVCVVEETDMKAVLKSLQAKSFPSEKLDLLGAIKKDKCFNVAQLKTISKEFAFDKDKIEALKMLYAGCPDKANYFKLVDELDFPYMRDDLTAFIKKESGN